MAHCLEGGEWFNDLFGVKQSACTCRKFPLPRSYTRVPSFPGVVSCFLGNRACDFTPCGVLLLCMCPAFFVRVCGVVSFSPHEVELAAFRSVVDANLVGGGGVPLMTLVGANLVGVGGGVLLRALLGVKHSSW